MIHQKCGFPKHQKKMASSFSDEKGQFGQLGFVFLISALNKMEPSGKLIMGNSVCHGQTNQSIQVALVNYKTLWLTFYTPNLLTLGVIYLHTKLCLATANNYRSTGENVARHGQTKGQPLVQGDVSQSPNSLKVK